MTSLLLRNLFFTILQPGLVAGLAPYWILKSAGIPIFTVHDRLQHYLAIILFLCGFIIMLLCILRFALEGRGTLSPADPTKKLVISGLYKYSRNPMYVGVMLMLIGESVYYNFSGLWVYTLCIFIAFYLFILFFEEPRLRRDFGDEYRQYCQRVRRWL